jgi:L,D-transpeptidase catalytic domain
MMRQRLVRGFVRWFSPETRFERAWHMGVSTVGLIVVLVLLADGAYGLFTHINQANALSAKAQLDHALDDATSRMHAPQGLLQPIRIQEQQVTTAIDGSLTGWQHAAQEYTRLQRQVERIVAMSPADAKVLTQNDLNQLVTAVAALANSKVAEATGYQHRLQQAQNAFNSAQTTRDFFALDGFVQDQVTAVAAYKPTHDRLVQFSALVLLEQQILRQVTGNPQDTPLSCAQGFGNIPAYYWGSYDGLVAQPLAQPGSQPVEAQWLADDQALFHQATTARDYVQLNQRLNGQIAQMQATNIALVPNAAASNLARFKTAIETLKDYDDNIPAIKSAFARIRPLSTYPALGMPGWSANVPAMLQFDSHIKRYQQQYDQDAQRLAGADFANYSRVVQQIQQHRDGMQFDLIYAKTYLDIKTLVDLIAQGQAHKTRNPTDGKEYPDAYEYIDQGTGIGDVINPDPKNLGRLYHASSIDDYQNLDLELRMFITNISAMLKNLDDPLTQAQFNGKLGSQGPGWDQIHQTDISLLQHYGILHTKVIVVSLREQVARLYENGKLAKSFKVTTGAQDLPSVPGIHCTIDKEFNTVFKSPDPPGSPNYYEPTPVNYAMIYHLYGYEIHDAYWRGAFGLYTNLPHADPAAFNGGSHGCVNVTTANMKWLMDPATGWLSALDHTPMLIY